jgi:hypothetical protein
MQCHQAWFPALLGLDLLHALFELDEKPMVLPDDRADDGIGNGLIVGMR